MSKITSYFSHDSNARNDEKILAVRMRHGAEGYGIYFMLLERLRDESDYMIIKDYNLLAFDFRVSSEKVKSVVEDFGLFNFTDDNKYIYSDSFLERMRKKDELSQKNSENGKRGAAKRWNNGEIIANATKKDSPAIASLQNSIASKESKVKKESKVNTPLPPEGESTSNSKTKIDFKKIVEVYHQSCPVMPRVQLLDKKRKAVIKARVVEHTEEKVLEMFALAGQSEFLSGQNDKNWMANFDWLLKPTNFIKTLEGNYTKIIRNNAKYKANDPRASLAEGYSERL